MTVPGEPGCQTLPTAGWPSGEETLAVSSGRAWKAPERSCPFFSSEFLVLKKKKKKIQLIKFKAVVGFTQ